MNKIIIVVIVIVVILGGGYLVMHKKSSTTSTSNSSSSGHSNTSSTTGSTSTDASGALNVKVVANDTSASPDTINATKGQKVNLTFDVSTSGTYHGGLDFKSTDPAIDSGSIAEGDSKTISFIASKSFKFTPYWYQSGVQKDYFVTVNVQ